jgi:polyhydroxyalkanoate synthesis repressor PhaR
MNKLRQLIKYSNRKLYDTTKKERGYVTLNDVAQFIEEGYQINVMDYKTKKDLTKKTLVSILAHKLNTNEELSIDETLNLLQDQLLKQGDSNNERTTI